MIKKIIMMMSAAMAIVCVQAATTCTETVDGIEWTYTVTDGKASVGGGSSYSTAIPKTTSGAITIPSTLGGYPVASIGDYAFYQCDKLTSMTIPDSVTSIGYAVFDGCHSLTSMTVPQFVCSSRLYLVAQGVYKSITNVVISAGVTSIGDYAFKGCSSLTRVTIPDSVTSVGSAVFEDCRSLTSVIIPQAICSAGFYSVFRDACKTITNIVISDDVTNIQDGEFFSCSGLLSITVEEGNSAYKSVDGLLLTSDGKTLIQGVNGSVTIPDSVTSIGKYAFNSYHSLTNVTIPGSVTNIGGRAFYGCSSLASIMIPDSVTSIGDDAFSDCSSLTSVKIPQVVCLKGLTSVFSSTCKTITNVMISDDVTRISDGAFASCSGLLSIAVEEGNSTYKSVNGLLLTNDGRTLVQGVNGAVTIPDSVTNIGDYAFYSCSSLTSITIPNTVTSIGASAFVDCSGLLAIMVEEGNPVYKSVDGLLLTSDGKTLIQGVNGAVTIPDSVTSIGDDAFRGRIGLTSVTICNGVTSIGSYAFYGCSSLAGVTIPDFVTRIGMYAFGGCSSLARVEIGNGVTNIDYNAFSNCRSLISVTIGNGVMSIGMYAFSGCSSLVNVMIPDSVRSIEKYAFYGCYSLVNVTMSDSVTSIGDDAFRGCLSITSVKIPQVVCSSSLSSVFHDAYTTITNVVISAGVTSIGDDMFYGCNGLFAIMVEEGNSVYKSVDGLLLTSDGKTLIQGVNGTVTIPDSVTRIGDDAFRERRGLTSVTMGNGVTSIGSYAFSGCSGLTSVLMGSGVLSIGEGAFSDCSSLASVMIPDFVTSIGAYAFHGCSGITSTTMGDGVTNIGRSAFSDCSSLTSVTLSDSLTSIEDSAFNGCSSLMRVTIPDSVASIGSYAFYGCNGLSSVSIGNGVTNIGCYAFVDCSSLTSVTIPDSVTCVGDKAFRGCGSLMNVSIGNSVKNIGGHAFDGCSSLANVLIPNSVASIGYETFRSCSDLGSLTIGNGVTSIAEYAFIYCSSLTNIVFKGNAPNVGYAAFSGINSDCVAYISRNATGFNLDSAGKWQGMPVRYYDSIDEDDSNADEGNNGAGGETDIGGEDQNSTTFVCAADGPSVLQAAIEAANEGDVILVGPGTYSPIRTNGKKITIKSTDGAANTIIDGGYTNRCATLADDTMGDWWLGDDSEQEQCVPLEPYNTILIGFTLCNGKSSWKGRVEYYEDGSQANVFFPRVVDGGGVFGGNIVNCVISNNVSELIFEKGSIFYEEDEESGEMFEEISEEDYEESHGGGVSCAKLYNCIVMGNKATGSGAGIDRCYAYNCTIVANESATHEDEDLNDVFDVENSEIYNTIMSVTPYWGGGYAMDVGDVKAENCAIVSETGDALPYNYFDECWNGDGDIYSYDFIVGDIKFVNPSIGDYRLQHGSVAIDAGVSANVQPLNLEYGDLDQNKRIKDIIDIGAYEYGAPPLVVPVYEMSFASGGATEGSVPEVILFKADEDVELPGCGSLMWPKHTFVGWSDGVLTYDSGAIYTGEGNVVMTAQWARNELAAPVIFAPETFEADSCEVTIKCDSGATIHYTLDGADPTAESSVYTGPIVITGTTEIKAIAIRDNYFDSTIASFKVTRGVWTFGEYLNWSGQEFETGDNGAWTRDKKVSFDGYALKSGKIQRNQKSCLTTTVQGAGTISFMLKVSSEADEETREPYDGFVLAVDGVEVTEFIGGEIDWRRVSFRIVWDGQHNIEWRYEKDKSVDVGEDCAWIDEVVWSPEDPIPELGASATASEVAAALDGSADANLAENIKTAAEYAAYRTWALGIKGVTAQQVKESPNAWLSFALDADGLIAAVPKEGDVVIDAFESAATDGAFEFTVKIDGIEVGDNALESNIRKVFDIEGTKTLVSGGVGFSFDNVVVNVATPENGNVKFTVTPKMENGEKLSSFFIRVKMK